MTCVSIVYNNICFLRGTSYIQLLGHLSLHEDPLTPLPKILNCSFDVHPDEDLLGEPVCILNKGFSINNFTSFLLHTRVPEVGSECCYDGIWCRIIKTITINRKTETTFQFYLPVCLNARDHCSYQTGGVGVGGRLRQSIS